MNSKLDKTDFPSFQTGGWGVLKMPTIILLPSPPPPFEMERTESKSHTLTFDFRLLIFDLKL
jgi:hypothetical protein